MFDFKFRQDIGNRSPANHVGPTQSFAVQLYPTFSANQFAQFALVVLEAHVLEDDSVDHDAGGGDEHNGDRRLLPHGSAQDDDDGEQQQDVPVEGGVEVLCFRSKVLLPIDRSK